MFNSHRGHERLVEARRPESVVLGARWTIVRLIDRLRSSRQQRGLAGTIRAGADYLRWRLGGSPPPPLRLDLASTSDWMDAYSELRPSLSAASLRTTISLVHRVRDTPPGVLDDWLDSLRNQTLAGWELVLVDDGSTSPATVEALSRLSRGSDRIIVVSAEGPGGDAVSAGIGLGAASGDYVMFLGEGDRLTPTTLEWIASCSPEADVIYTDEAVVGSDGSPPDPFFKPAWSPRLLLSLDYPNHVVCVRRSAAQAAGGIVQGTDGVHVHDLLLRLSDRGAVAAHVPILGCERHAASDEQEVGPETSAIGVAMVQRAIERRGWNAVASTMEEGVSGYRVVFRPAASRPLVKIVMPTRDKIEFLRRAVHDVLQLTDGVDVHIVVVDNGSSDPQTMAFLDELSVTPPNITVVRVDEPFNFSRLSNLGAAAGPDAPYVLFLNNDIEIVHRDWLLQLVGWLRDDPGVVGVGPKLLYPDGRIQHAGMIVGFSGLSGHYASKAPNRPAVGNLHDRAREIGALTAACLLLRTEDFSAIGGFVEELPVDFQDVDLSLRLRRDRGGVLMYDPTYPLVHHESATRGFADSSEATIARMNADWGETLAADDPYYSPHLSLRRHDLSMRDAPNDERLLGERLQPRWSGGAFGGTRPSAGDDRPTDDGATTAERDRP